MGAAVLIPLLIAGGTTAITMTAQRHQEKKAEKKAKKEKAEAMARAQQQQDAYAMMAGEHWDEINREQMELQAQEGQMALLLDIIKDKQKPPARVYVMPPAKTYTPVQRINMALDQIFKRAG